MRLLSGILILMAFSMQSSPAAVVAVGKGVQIYACGPDGMWVFEAPEATLYKGSAVVGLHGKGPHWTWKDGSGVSGKVVSSKPAPDPAHDVAWLILSAEAMPGKTGVLTGVVRVTRTETHGGVAPASGCKAGQTASMPYTATYSFWTQ